MRVCMSDAVVSVGTCVSRGVEVVVDVCEVEV